MADLYAPRTRSFAPYLFLLTVVLGVLKLVGLFPWSWWWVLAPLWVPTVIGLFGSLLAVVIVLITPSRRPRG